MLALVTLLGCASWQPQEPRVQLPAPQAAPNTVACQIAFVQWNAREPEHNEQFWAEIDEQFLELEVREALRDNGLRVGLRSGPLPAEIMDKLQSTRDVAKGLMAEKLPRGTDMLYRREARQCRFGIGEVIEVLPECPNMKTFLLNENGHVKVRQRERPRGILLLTPHAQDEGRLRLELVPGLEFGEPQQRVTGNAGMMRYEIQRDQEIFHALAFSALVRPGQTLVVTATDEPKGVGAAFFADRFATQGDRLLMLLYVARGRDDLFLPPEQLEPLVTPVE